MYLKSIQNHVYFKIPHISIAISIGTNIFYFKCFSKSILIDNKIFVFMLSYEYEYNTIKVF